LTGWGKWEGNVRAGGESGFEQAEQVVGEQNNSSPLVKETERVKGVRVRMRR
jgi:hypothetical protein